MFIHSESTYLSIDGDDISQFCNASDLDRTQDSHDVTTYGKSAHVYQGGLADGTASISGIYDNTTGTGPRAVLRPLATTRTPVELIRRPEGTGTGKPQDTVDVLVTSYKEDAPIADMVKWTASLQLSDAVASTTQPS